MCVILQHTIPKCHVTIDRSQWDQTGQMAVGDWVTVEQRGSPHKQRYPHTWRGGGKGAQ